MSNFAPAPSTNLTRAGVARILDCSITHVRRLERERSLTPRIDPSSRVRSFDRAEVEAYRARLDRDPRRRRNGSNRPKRAELHAVRERGELEARVFACFDEGHDLATTVVRAKVPIALVRELRRQYETDFDEGERQRRREEVQQRVERASARQRREQAEKRRLEVSLERARLLGGSASSSTPTTLPDLPSLPDAGAAKPSSRATGR